MKKLRLFAAILVAMMAAVGCTQPTPNDDESKPKPEPPTPDVEAPVVTLSQQAVELNSAGSPVSVAYQIENPIEGQSVAVSHDADWLTVDSSTASTAIAFGYADGVMTTTYVARSASLTTLAAQ